MEYLSKECYDRISSELNNLINVEYPKIKDALSEARAQGDLSENFEYRAARRAQAKTISRIKYLQKVLQFSRVIDPKNLPKGQATLLSKVRVTNLETNVQSEYTLVSPHETDFQAGKISIKSPVGEALMGTKPGDIITVEAPAAHIRFRIDDVSEQ